MLRLSLYSVEDIEKNIMVNEYVNKERLICCVERFLDAQKDVDSEE